MLLLAITLVSLVVALVMSVSRGGRRRTRSCAPRLGWRRCQIGRRRMPSAEAGAARGRKAQAGRSRPRRDARTRGASVAERPRAEDRFATRSRSRRERCPGARDVSVPAASWGETRRRGRAADASVRWRFAAAVVAIVLGRRRVGADGATAATPDDGPAQAAPRRSSCCRCGTIAQAITCRWPAWCGIPPAGVARRAGHGRGVPVRPAGPFVTSAQAPIRLPEARRGRRVAIRGVARGAATVARYRVSFRTEDGIVPHVDRRGEPPVSAGG